MSINPFYLHGEELSPVRKLLFMKALAGGAPLSEYDATGNPLTFTTNVAKPLKSLVANFTPVQSGTGDPSPDNVLSISGWGSVNLWHTGKNLIDDTKKYQSGTTTVYIGATDNSRNIFLKAGKYTVTRDFNNETIGLYYIKRDAVSEKTIFNTSTTDLTKTITVAEDGYYGFFAYRGSASGGVSSSDIKSVMLEVGETASTYAPYSGTSYPVTFPAMGKNLYDATTYPLTNGSFIYAGTGTVGTNANYSCTLDYVPCSYFAGNKVTLNKRSRGSSPGIAFYDADKVYISGQANLDGTEGTPLSFNVPDNAIYMRFSSMPSATDVQIELGSSSTTFEPYTNTLYGGYVDLVTGEVWKEWLFFTYKWSDFILPTTLGDYTRKQKGITQEKIKAQTSRVGERFCNIATWKADYSDESTHYYFYQTDGWCNAFVFLPTGTDGNTDIQFACKLVSPVLVATLTHQQITALIGDNTILSDANGNCEVTYLKKG